jgi:serine/threonine protein kinase
VVVIEGRYEYDPIGDCIGQGSLSQVFRARDRLLNRIVALKIYSVSGRNRKTVLDRLREAIRFEHGNVLCYHDILILERSDALGDVQDLQIAIMEYANAGNLGEFVRRYPNSPELPRLLREVLHGLEYLNSLGVMHRDLKGHRILLVEQNGALNAKIIPPGCDPTDLEGFEEIDVSFDYAAPEEIDPRQFGIDGTVQPNVDLWSFGVMVHELLTGRGPFSNLEDRSSSILDAIVSAELPQSIDRLPEPYRQVVKKCLVRSARQRVQRPAELLADLGRTFSADYGAPFDDETSIMPPPADDLAETKVLRPENGNALRQAGQGGQREALGNGLLRPRNLAIAAGLAAVALWGWPVRHQNSAPTETSVRETQSTSLSANGSRLADAMVGKWDWPPLYRKTAQFACSGEFLTTIKREGGMIEVDEVSFDRDPQPIPNLNENGWMELEGALFKIEGDKLKVAARGRDGKSTFYSLERCQ